ncbi:MAG TPA: hypothetical protein VLM11_04290 [Streptosporangiaceae bacterium]|nr:hypothetical protein [Streptosporangiaceae bacterium]
MTVQQSAASGDLARGAVGLREVLFQTPIRPRVLGTFEILIFLALAIWLIVKAGSANTGSVPTLHFATIKGYQGFSGVIASSIYTILAFLLGLGVLIYLYVRHPSRLPEMKRVFKDERAPVGAAVASGEAS